jgi:hypothetical protein
MCDRLTAGGVCGVHEIAIFARTCASRMGLESNPAKVAVMIATRGSPDSGVVLTLCCRLEPVQKTWDNVRTRIIYITYSTSISSRVRTALFKSGTLTYETQRSLSPMRRSSRLLHSEPWCGGRKDGCYEGTEGHWRRRDNAPHWRSIRNNINRPGKRKFHVYDWRFR